MCENIGPSEALARTWVRAGGRSQSLNGAPLRRAPGGSMSSEGRLRGDLLLRVPELTRSVGIQLTERVSLRRRCKILSSSQSCGLADAIPQPCVPRD